MSITSTKNNCDLIIKIILSGNSNVGKTKIIHQYLKKPLPSSNPTIGVDFLGKDTQILNKKVKIQFFDTAGQEKYRSICQSYYKSCQGILLIYDITDRNSFDSINKWLKDIKELCDLNVKILLVGNKTDLESQRCVSTKEGMALSEENGLFFIETSAKEDFRVDLAFDILLKEVVKIDEEDDKEGKRMFYDKINIEKIEGEEFNKGCKC